MPYLLDTNIVIHMVEGQRAVIERVLALGERPTISAVTIVELEGGISGLKRTPSLRARVEAMVATLDVAAFTHVAGTIYGEIIAHAGFSRPRLIDRMIAAQAIVLDATLITMNGDDFQYIPALKTEVWRLPFA